MTRSGLVGILLVAGCRAGHPPLAPLMLLADSSHREVLAPGLTHYAFVIQSGPWAVHVLDIDRRACWRLRAVKAGNAAVGRATTLALVEAAEAVGGVNADFFSFTPPGVPTGAMIHRGRVITGPVNRPVFAVDSSGRPWIGVLRSAGVVVAGRDSVRIDGWNRKVAGGLAYIDSAYGPLPDTTGGARFLTQSPARPIAVRVRIEPFHPLEAVGGFPLLVRDSVAVDTLDRAGSATFAPVRHPRTLAGIAAGGRRVLLVTVDGRQEGYSVGMTLREGAQLMRDLGATEALNLDGGGSTTMVVRRGVANRPSDAAGPRAVANALAVVAGCSRS